MVLPLKPKSSFIIMSMFPQLTNCTTAGRGCHPPHTFKKCPSKLFLQTASPRLFTAVQSVITLGKIAKYIILVKSRFNHVNFTSDNTQLLYMLCSSLATKKYQQKKKFLYSDGGEMSPKKYSLYALETADCCEWPKYTYLNMFCFHRLLVNTVKELGNCQGSFTKAN